MAAGATVTGFGQSAEFHERSSAIDRDGMNHLILGDLETLANDAFRAAPDGGTAMAAARALGRGLNRINHCRMAY
jgi:hypothetical protein